MFILLLISAINGFISVAAGAFGAHGLQGRLPPAAVTIFETGARYQMYHALAIGLCALAVRAGAPAGWAGALFTAGIVLFSGSLYAYTLLGWRFLVFVTPVGGVLFLAGWAMLAWAAFSLRSME